MLKNRFLEILFFWIFHLKIQYKYLRKITSHDFLRWVRILDKIEDFFFCGKKTFFNIQRIDLKSLLAIQLGCSYIWQKFQDDWLARFLGKLCTNLKNMKIEDFEGFSLMNLLRKIFIFFGVVDFRNFFNFVQSF